MRTKIGPSTQGSGPATLLTNTQRSGVKKHHWIKAEMVYYCCQTNPLVFFFTISASHIFASPSTANGPKVLAPPLLEFVFGLTKLLENVHWNALLPISLKRTHPNLARIAPQKCPF